MPPEDDASGDLRSALLAAVAGQDEPVVEVEETVDEKPSRSRDEHGRFAKHDAEPEPKAAEEPVEAAEEVTEEEKPVEEKPTGKEAPANWSKADKETFAKVPPEAQDFLLRRHSEMEADYTRKTQKIAAFEREYAPIDQMFAPHAEDLKRAGYTPSTLIQAWYNVERELQQGRGVGIVKSLVDGYKLDRGEIAKALGLTAPTAGAGVEQPAAPDQPTSAIPPELARELNELKSWRAQQEQERANAARAQQAAEANRVMSTIEEFKGAKDQAGNLAHPHFEEVEAEMTRLAIAARTAGQPVPSLDALYDQAVWANPSTRAKALEAQRAADEAQRAAASAKAQKDARAKAEAARKAASSVTGAPSNGQAATQARQGAGSLRESILAAMEDAAA